MFELAEGKYYRLTDGLDCQRRAHAVQWPVFAAGC